MLGLLLAASSTADGANWIRPWLSTNQPVWGLKGGLLAEVEFYAGDQKIHGTPFGTTGSHDNAGRDFAQAVDGDISTFFDGRSHDTVPPTSPSAGWLL